MSCFSRRFQSGPPAYPGEKMATVTYPDRGQYAVRSGNPSLGFVVESNVRVVVGSGGSGT